MDGTNSVGYIEWAKSTSDSNKVYLPPKCDSC